MSNIPFGLLTSRSKTDHVKQLKELFSVIENEQDKEKRNYEDVINRRTILIDHFYFISSYCFLGN